MRELLLDCDRLVRAVASVSRSRYSPVSPPAASRAELRPVLVKGALKLSVNKTVGTQAFTANYDSAAAPAAIDELLSQADPPFDNWRVETASETLSVSRNASGALVARRGPPPVITAASRSHDREKQRMLDPSSPVLQALGISTADGRVRADKASKFAQVDAFCRVLDVAVQEALDTGRLPRGRPIRIVDLGCGNAYLTFAAVALLAVERGIPCTMTGIDVKRQARERNTDIARGLGWAATCRFVEGSISGAVGAFPAGEAPDVVLALHACDTATDDALAAAVHWQAPLVLASPCCHHTLNAQLKQARGEASPFPALTKHAMLRERLGDVLTDAVRAHVLALCGYRVTVSDFVGSEHTPRNLLIRADLTRARPQASDVAELDAMCSAWGVQAPLVALLKDRLDSLRMSTTRG